MQVYLIQTYKLFREIKEKDKISTDGLFGADNVWRVPHLAQLLDMVLAIEGRDAADVVSVCIEENADRDRGSRDVWMILR